jgi:hypothetical protein
MDAPEPRNQDRAAAEPLAFRPEKTVTEKTVAGILIYDKLLLFNTLQFLLVEVLEGHPPYYLPG